MKSDYIAAAILVRVAVAIGAGMNAVHPSSDYCASPSPASVEALFAPCQAFDTATGPAPTCPALHPLGCALNAH